jgi:hypothetical protein
LQAFISAADVAKAGTASVTVTNPGMLVSNVVFFPVTAPSASIAMAGKQVFPNCGATVAGDFNGDGKLDVAWADANSETVNISLGNGKGGFLAPIPFSFVTLFPGPAIQMIAGDFNGDGKLDVAVIDSDGDVKVLLGNGDGTLSFAWLDVRHGVESYIGAADFNQDGMLDMYISGHVLGPAWFQIYLGAGDGRFGFYQQYITNGFANFAGVPAIGDFTGNGKLDLIVPEINPNYGQLYLGNGDGTFVASNTVGSQFAALAADFNHDGRVDLVVTQNGAETKLFRNQSGKSGLRVKLIGPLGNRDGIGATLWMTSNGTNGPAREIHAGSGYWSQDSPVQVLAGGGTELHVRWPGGKVTVTRIPPGAKEMTVDSSGNAQVSP